MEAHEADSGPAPAGDGGTGGSTVLGDDAGGSGGDPASENADIDTVGGAFFNPDGVAKVGPIDFPLDEAEEDLFGQRCSTRL